MIPSEKIKSLRVFLTPSGAVAVTLCFFLPWIKLSCLGTHSYSGAQLGGRFWLVFGAGILNLVCFFVFRYLRRMKIGRSIVIISALVALAVILIESLVAAAGKRILLITVKPEHLNPSIEIGGIGTITGLLLMLLGTKFMRFPSSPTDHLQDSSPDKLLPITK